MKKDFPYLVITTVMLLFCFVTDWLGHILSALGLIGAVALIWWINNAISPDWAQRVGCLLFFFGYFLFYFFQRQRLNQERRETLRAFTNSLAWILLMSFLGFSILHFRLGVSGPVWNILGWPGLASAGLLFLAYALSAEPNPKRRKRKKRTYDAFPMPPPNCW